MVISLDSLSLFFTFACVYQMGHCSEVFSGNIYWACCLAQGHIDKVVWGLGGKYNLLTWSEKTIKSLFELCCSFCELLCAVSSTWGQAWSIYSQCLHYTIEPSSLWTPWWITGHSFSHLIFSAHECVLDYSLSNQFFVRNIKQDQQMQISKILPECIIITIFIRFPESGVALGI